ncbi:MAG: hypothetical protein ABJ370_18215 [Paracoccaceae bacterium]
MPLILVLILASVIVRVLIWTFIRAFIWTLVRVLDLILVLALRPFRPRIGLLTISLFAVTLVGMRSFLLVLPHLLILRLGRVAISALWTRRRF